MNKDVIVLTKDIEFKKDINRLLTDRQYQAFFEEDDGRYLLKTLNHSSTFTILDLSYSSKAGVILVRILNKIKPGISMIVFNDKADKEEMRILKELGIFYYSIKPLKVEEMSMIIDSIMRIQND